MHLIKRLAVLSGILGGSLFGGSIGLDITSLGTNNSGQPTFRYSYTLTGFTFMENQELDFRFDPSVFASLSNPVAPPEYGTLVLQPNNPPGAFGDFSVLALINNPPTLGPFSVDVALVAPSGSGTQGQVPAPPQRVPFLVNQFQPLGGDLVLEKTLSTGTALTSAAAAEVPEPSTFTFGAISLALFGWGLVSRRRSANR